MMALPPLTGPRYLIPVDVPDGEYEGRWSAYDLVFEYDGREVHQATSLGVRGINIPTRFRIKDGKLDESSMKTLGPSQGTKNSVG